MKRRIYWLMPDLASARRAMRDLLQARVEVAQIHFAGPEGMDMTGLHALKPRFAAYEQANRINEHPWLADLVIWRARRSRRLVRQLGEVLEESRSPGPLGTAAGLLQLLLPQGGSS